MIKISIIGFGSIGKFVFKKLSEKNIKIQSLICKPGREEIAKKAFGSGIEIKNDIDELDDLPDLILDCAGHDALKMFAAKALIKGINFITLSSGALSDEPILKDIQRSQKLGKSKFIIAKGAVGSLDILEAAKESGISKVEYIGRKPPKAWKGSRAEKIINLDYLQKKSEVHFTGNAREASKLYPKNANVAATIALMGIGFEKTKVKLIADDTISENVHELVISGEFGESQFKILGKPLPDNPKSSSLAAMSIIDETKKFIDNFEINM